MSDTPAPPPDPRDDIRRQWLEHSARVFDRLFPQQADEPLPDFATLEQKTDNLARDLTCWLLQQRLNSDPLAAPRPQDPPGCPRCGRPGRLLGMPQQLPRRVLTTQAGEIEFRRVKYRCPACRVVFSPLDDRLGLTAEGFSPKVLQLAVRQAGQAPFASASDELQALGNIRLSPAHRQRLCERVGGEWAAARDADVAAFRAGQLQPGPAAAPAVAAVLLDGGRLQSRVAGAGRGVPGKSWHETKVACCLSLSSREKVVDPQPEPPAAFLEPPRVARLTHEIQSRTAGGTRPGVRSGAGPKAQDQAGPTHRRRRRRAGKPRKLVRTVVASLANSDAFGWHVSAEVHRRRLGEAKRKACVCDGLNWNWSIFASHLLPLGFIGILDVVHRVTHLYAASQAAEPAAAAAWALYERWLRWAWAGEVVLLLAGLRAVAVRLGSAPAEAKEDEPRKVLASTVTYVENNRERMKYPEYRKQGLPISSAPVESVIKQLNGRLKGSEKFWRGGGAEAVLQVRAAYLSEDGRAERYWKRPRPRGRAVGGGRLGRRC